MFTFCLERPTDHPYIEFLLDAAFGDDRHLKASYRLRDGQPSIPHLNHVILDAGGTVCGTVRFWAVSVKDLISGQSTNALLLGPIAVCPTLQNKGLGAKLLDTAVTVAEDQGHKRILLVGDCGYYERFGFKSVLPNFITLPGGKDARRLMVKQSPSLPSLPAVGRLEVPHEQCMIDPTSYSASAAALSQMGSL